MITYFAFLRGINVGGHKKILMQELRDTLSSIGLINIKTYIQSGNVVFQSKEKNIENIERSIQQAILKHFEFDVPTLIKTPSQIETILNKYPFSQDIKEKSYFVLLKQLPFQAQILELNKINYPNEKFKLMEDCIYLYSSVGHGKSKYSNNFFEKKLNVSATTRNHRTLVKLLALSISTD